MYKHISQCVSAVNMLYFSQFKPHYYSPLSLLSYTPLLGCFSTYQ
jgi:hypothetical protein